MGAVKTDIRKLKYLEINLPKCQFLDHTTTTTTHISKLLDSKFKVSKVIIVFCECTSNRQAK
jgi:hypothetical protein